MNITYPLTIYYDASCPLCRTEMETLKQTDYYNKLILVDCSNANLATPQSCPVTREAMMERIYAQDAKGLWINSVDVFAAAYDAAGFNNIAKILANSRLKPYFTRIYPWIADNRYWLSKTPLPYLLNSVLRLSAKFW